ncbi:hypothetical protein PTKIN_Ptkin14bG0208200 [Pterospermum kingtungense]
MAFRVQNRSSTCDRFMKEIEASKIDGVLLMSLLEESYCEEFISDEQLNSVMLSLEEEISVRTIKNNDFSMESEIIMEVNRDCRTLECDFDYFEWDEMEMVPSLPSNCTSWYVEEMEFVDDSYSQNYYVDNVPLQDQFFVA